MEETNPLVFYIPGNTPSSKNNRVWTGKYFIFSAATQRWIRKTKKTWEEHKQRFLDGIAGLEKPYYIEFTFVRKTRHKFDYVNIAQAPLDMMKKFGWVEDDNATIVKPYFGDFIYDKRNPGLYIKILKEKPKHDLQA